MILRVITNVTVAIIFNDDGSVKSSNYSSSRETEQGSTYRAVLWTCSLTERPNEKFLNRPRGFLESDIFSQSSLQLKSITITTPDSKLKILFGETSLQFEPKTDLVWSPVIAAITRAEIQPDKPLEEMAETLQGDLEEEYSKMILNAGWEQSLGHILLPVQSETTLREANLENFLDEDAGNFEQPFLIPADSSMEKLRLVKLKAPSYLPLTRVFTCSRWATTQKNCAPLRLIFLNAI